MAYGNGGFTRNTTGTASKAPVQQKAVLGTEESDIFYSTGLFAGKKKDGTLSKVVGEIQLKEDLTIPAGYRIKIVPTDKTKYKSKNPPAFNMMVVKGVLKQS